MFDNLNTQSYKKFRKDIAIKLGKFLRELSDDNDSLRDQPIWALMQEVKGKILDESIPFRDIINQMPDGKTDDPAILLCIQNLKSILVNPLYNKMFEQENVKGQPSHTTNQAILFPAKEEQEKKAESKEETLAEHLLFQIDNISNNSIDKTELIRVLMRVAQPDNYNGYFIDVHNDVSRHVTLPSEKEITNREDRLREIEHRTNQILFGQIDRLIEESLSKGLERLRIIVKTGVHYTPIDIDITTRSCFICDAAQDFRRSRLHQIAKYSKHVDADRVIDAQSPGFEFDGRINHDGKLQKSDQGCSIFSLYHSFELSKLDTLHEDIIKKSTLDVQTGIRIIEWLYLPPSIVKVGQSTNFIAYYKFVNPKHAKEIDALTNNNEKFYGYNQAVNYFRDKIMTLALTPSLSDTQSVNMKSRGY